METRFAKVINDHFSATSLPSHGMIALANGVMTPISSNRARKAMATAIPDWSELVAKVRQAAKYDLYPVQDLTIAPMPAIIRADTVSFHPNSKLVFVSTNPTIMPSPVIVIAARRLLFTTPLSNHHISFDPSAIGLIPPNGSNGIDGQNGTSAPGQAPAGNDGVSGGNGSNGTDGSEGESWIMPTLLLFVQEIEPGANFNMTVNLSAYANTPSGRGGAGGKGGNGQTGGDSDDFCTKKVGAGGFAGNGGRAGKGGPGVNGQPGGNILLFTDNSATRDSFGYFTIHQGGARASMGGAGGKGGARGVGGARGANKVCGFTPPSRMPDGSDGPDGAKGLDATTNGSAGSLKIDDSAEIDDLL